MMAVKTLRTRVYGKTYTAFKGLVKFQARDGMIELVELRTGYVHVISPATAEQRGRAFEEYATKVCDRLNFSRDRDWLREMRPLILSLQECCKEARAQGDPTDAKTREFWARHHRGSGAISQNPFGIQKFGKPKAAAIPSTAMPSVAKVRTPLKLKAK